MRQQPINATFYGCNHAEAYCLMLYRTRDGIWEEWIWNSRDGVTPFIVFSKEGREMNHVEWYRDRFLPQHIPEIGARVFVDLTRALALPLARERVERDWERPQYPMKEAFTTKEAAVETLLSSWLEREGSPHIVEVTEEMRAEFARRPKLQFKLKGK